MAASHSLEGIISPPASLLEVDDLSQRDDDSELDLASLTSSVLEYEFENGRRYHGYRAGSYPLPNDEAEWERMDIKHHVFLLLCSGNLHLAPLEKPKSILDIGTGTGIWAIEMADQYPESSIIGTDLSPIQPTWVPNNVHFEIDDFEDRHWIWREDHFDFIHSRFLTGSVSSYSNLIRNAFKHLQPGGYYELQELDPRFGSDDGTLNGDSNLTYWSKAVCEASERYNRRVPFHTEYKAWFEEAGFECVSQYMFRSPTNPWPKNKVLKEVGKFQLLAHLEGIEGISMALMTRALQWKPEEVSVLFAKMRPELKDRSIHSYQPHFVVFGRKPEKRRTSIPSSNLSPSFGPSPPSSLRTIPSGDLSSNIAAETRESTR